MNMSDDRTLQGSPDDETPELSADLARFVEQLRGCTPAAADMDPAIAFYRAGYAAGMADRKAVPHGRVTVLRQVASWLLILALGGAVGYLWGGMRGETGGGRLEAGGVIHEVGGESREAGRGERKTQDQRPEMEAGGWDVAEADVAGLGKERDSDGLGDRALGKGEVELVWSRIVGWSEVGERRPIFVGMGQGYFASPRARKTLMDNLLAQIHGPLAQPPVTPPSESGVASPLADAAGSTSNGTDPPRALRPSDRFGPLQPTSLRDVIEQRAQLLESLLQ